MPLAGPKATAARSPIAFEQPHSSTRWDPLAKNCKGSTEHWLPETFETGMHGLRSHRPEQGAEGTDRRAQHCWFVNGVIHESLA